MKIVLPDVGESKSVLVGDDHIAFLSVQHDECQYNPLVECDCYGEIVSFCRRHSSFRDPGSIEKDPDAVTLSYFEHGLCQWGVRGSMSSMPDFRWDGVEIAGMWLPNDCVREAVDGLGLTPEGRRKWLEDAAATACEIFTSYCNGQVYFATIAVYPLRRKGNAVFQMLSDYRFDEPLLEDCCGGFYAEGDVVEFFRDNLVSVSKMLELELEVAE